MTLARKGSRGITVDGVAYRWVVSPDDGYMVLVVQMCDQPGQRLEAFFKYRDITVPGGHIVGQLCSIRPGVVRAVILAALQRGWQPSVRGLRVFVFMMPRRWSQSPTTVEVSCSRPARSRNGCGKSTCSSKARTLFIKRCDGSPKSLRRRGFPTPWLEEWPSMPISTNAPRVMWICCSRPRDWKSFSSALLGKGYARIRNRPRRFLDRISGITIDFLVTGLFPGNGEPGPIAYPDPDEASKTIDKIQVVDLVTLVQLKLAARRWRDFADVVELIRYNRLDEPFSARLHSSVRGDFIECLEEKRREDDYAVRRGEMRPKNDSKGRESGRKG